LWFVAGALIAGLGYAGFWRLTSSGPMGPVEIRSYEVRPEIAANMSSALESALGGIRDAPLGRVGIAPDGRHLLVTATRQVQAGVADAIAQMADYVPEPAVAVTFEAWLVTAAPGEPSSDPALAEIEPALAAIRKAKGPARFRLLEKLSTVGRPGGDSSEVGSEIAGMRVKPPSIHRTADGKTVVATDIEIGIYASGGARGSNLDASVQLPPGELMVIGQSGFATKEQAGTMQLYCIVRATF
jgi:hypothetical protein